MAAKKILVVDEPGFTKICRALLSRDGFAVASPESAGVGEHGAEGYDLVIASYPYGADFVGRMQNREVPVLLLADCLSRELMESVRSVRKFSCLIKPLDFERFQAVVQRMLGLGDDVKGEYRHA